MPGLGMQIQLAHHICGFLILGVNQLLKKIPESSKKQNLNLHPPLSPLATVYIVLTLY